METHSSHPANQSIIAVAVLLMIASLGLTYQFLVPRLVQAKTDAVTADANLAGVKKNVDTLHSINQQMADAVTAAKNRGVDVDNLPQVLPASADVYKIYIQMETLMNSATGIDTPTYQVGTPAVDSTGVTKIPVVVTGAGSYANLQNFLDRMELNIRPLSFSSIAFSFDSGKGSYTLSATGVILAQGSTNPTQ